jgi:inorganic triphosphatase YgiF
LQKEWNIPINHLEETLTLKTLRAKYNLDYNNGLFEIVFDKTTPFVNGEVLKPNYMIECELKKGNSSGLFLINRVISKLDFIKECKFSKKEIA